MSNLFRLEKKVGTNRYVVIKDRLNHKQALAIQAAMLRRDHNCRIVIRPSQFHTLETDMHPHPVSIADLILATDTADAADERAQKANEAAQQARGDRCDIATKLAELLKLDCVVPHVLVHHGHTYIMSFDHNNNWRLTRVTPHMDGTPVTPHMAEVPQ